MNKTKVSVLSTSPGRLFIASDGNTIMIADACINTQAYLRTERDLDYRLYIIELSIEWVEEKEELELSREFSMPSIRSKGTIPPRTLRLPKPALISAIKQKKTNKGWQCKPEITHKGNSVTVVVPNMPSTVSRSVLKHDAQFPHTFMLEPEFLDARHRADASDLGCQLNTDKNRITGYGRYSTPTDHSKILQGQPASRRKAHRLHCTKETVPVTYIEKKKDALYWNGWLVV